MSTSVARALPRLLGCERIMGYIAFAEDGILCGQEKSTRSFYLKSTHLSHKFMLILPSFISTIEARYDSCFYSLLKKIPQKLRTHENMKKFRPPPPPDQR